MVLGEILTLMLGPTVAAGLSADPELAGILEEDGGLTGEGREPLLRWVLFLASVLVTLLFGWQPTLAAVFVLLGSAFGLVGLVEADHAHLTPQAFSGGVVLGAAMVTRYSHRVFVWFALGALILPTVAGEVLTDGTWADGDSLKGVMVITLIVALCVAVPAFMIRRSRHRARDREAALRRAEEAAACAAEAERQRIAAELHDVVAHGLTVISMQAAMPAQLPGARFTIRFRQQPVVIHMTQREVTVSAGEGMWHDVPMIIAGREHTLSPGEKLTVPLG